MPKTTTIPVLLSLATAALLSACDPLQAALDPLRPMTDLCSDDGNGCPPPPPEPQDFKKP
ncbi:MAG: hypothetical protein H6712_24940 [Myxococcales bacterium]|nr:hypothetical protein [Myxococcales bacterium]MCB9717126.1 hypothetical protein [Myxococcales bacterium]